MAENNSEPKMDWRKLLSSKRLLERGKTENGDIKHEEVRSEFEKDADRIIFSYPFRRLQNKTQVIPVPVYDFIHTRLTHSLEAATIGNSLGRTVGRKIIEKHKINESKEEGEKDITEYDFGAIVKAACLVHDIGNPPFGHSGERSMSDFFKQNNISEAYGSSFKGNLNEEKFWEDFQNFEGNAMGFRVINNPHYSCFNLTCATLATFTKYPRESIINKDLYDSIKKENLYYLNEKEEYKTHRISQKKFGFFQSERDTFKRVAEEVGLLKLGDENNLSWCRHPLAFLVEAADDISYTLMDLEDAYKVGRISEAFVVENLVSIAYEKLIFNDEYYKGSGEQKVDFIKEEVRKYFNVDFSDNKEMIGFLRGKVIFRLVDEVSSLFMMKEDDILKGIFDEELLGSNDFKYKGNWSKISRKLNKTVYKNFMPIEELEVVGSEVLRGLLLFFIPAVFPNLSMNKGIHIHPPHYEEQLLKIIPKQCQLGKISDTLENASSDKLYYRLMGIVDYVSGMTDNYALQLYRKLKGIDIPHLQNLVIN